MLSFSWVSPQLVDKWVLSALEGAESTRATHSMIYCRRIPGRVLCDDYTTSWNDQQRTKELSQKRKDMYADPLDLLIQSVRD